MPICPRSGRVLESKRTSRDQQVPLHIRHDERANGAVIAAMSKTHMAVEVLTRLHLLTLKEVAGGDIEPTGDGFHQLVAGNREAIHIAAAHEWIPRMR